MKKIGICLIILILFQAVAVSALTASEARQEWRDAKDVSRDAQETHREAKIKHAGDKTAENEQEVVDTGKVVLNAALDEVEAWLVWKNLEAEENPDVPEDIKQAIKDDVDANLDKIDELREDVDGITNRLELGLVFLKMVGKYVELLADVGRNSGAMWVHIANTRADTIEDYEEKLRDSTDDADVIELLDNAKDELEIARRNIDNAEDTYKLVKVPGTPLIKFAEGNNYLRNARLNLINAHKHLNQAYREMVRGE
jgi:hypothetical protein